MTSGWSQALILALFVFCPYSYSHAGDVPRSPELEPWMTKRGDLLLSEDFSQPTLDAAWTVPKGKWEIVEGGLKGIELEQDHHAAVVRRSIDFESAIFQFSFRFDGGKAAHLSINGKQGHICRVTITPSGFSLRKDKPNKRSDEKPALLAQVPCSFKKGQWYTMLVELQGNAMLARIDDRTFAFGEASGLDPVRTNFGFPVSGDSVCFDDVKIWNASPNPEWSTLRRNLSAKRREQPSPSKGKGTLGKRKR